MKFASLITSAALSTGAAAQFVTWSNNGYGIELNVPSKTASSGSGSIFFQITAPKGAQWASFGQGSQMNGATMFVIYSSGSNVVLSTRSGKGHNMPTNDSSIQAKLLDGSQVNSDGSMVANIQCDNCLSAMSATDNSANWIMAYKTGSALNTNSQSASIQQHNAHSSFTLDLTTGTGGDSANPFVQSVSSSSASSAAASSSASSSSASSASHTATSSNSAMTSGTSTSASGTSSTASRAISSSSSSATATTIPNSSSSTSDTPSSGPSNSPFAHGVLMSILFVGFFPLFALTLYLPTTKKVRYIHAPLQMISVILLIAGLALGIIYGKTISELSGAHQIIGYIVVLVMVLAQPAMGIYQNLYYHRTGSRSSIGAAHQWLGRAAIVLGIINGGIGWNLTDTKKAYAPYAIVAVIVFLIYVAVVVFSMFRQRRLAGYPQNKEAIGGRGYEMHGKKIGRPIVQEEEFR